ncbi:TRAP transporter large permease [Candidatus Poribacteria bacterium]|nr:TRAP transporter large permease [Candidatus Poribacteria bacterium]MYB63542.1 TRAP transporter large permease [Candidatus Poribacteria bacterium]MYF56269.1 TRAP transporter large permease [Candidatus Poribacteria bacterium]MYI92826.1 TRAP transporter large permease [Candidatus Poribacteria bacterium]
MGILIGFGLVAFALLGGALFVLLGGATIIGFAAANEPINVILIEINRLTKHTTIIIIPLFTLAGYIIAEGKAPQRLVAFARASVGWLPGGIAIVVLVTCAFFTTFTGASGVTIIALGGLVYPILRQTYNENFSLGLITASGSIGLLFPPSIPLILYAIIAEVPIDAMFFAGIIPGIIILVILSSYCSGWSLFKKTETTPFNWEEFLRTLWDAKWELLLPFLVLGGILTGFVSLDEVAALTVIYVCIVEMCIHKSFSVKALPRLVKESMVLVGAILIILAMALALTNYLITLGVPDMVLDWITSITDNKIITLIGLNVFLLIVGCMMDIFSAIVIIVPLLLPMADALGIDKVHLGVIVLTNLEIGYLTPPIGMNLFISSMKFKKSVVLLYRSVLLFIGLLLIALILVTYIPDLSLWLPKVLGKVSEPLF